MKTTCEVTLYDLMGEDYDVWINPSKKQGFDLQIFDWKGQKIVDEDAIHTAAMDSFADMCRRFVRMYDTAKQRVEAVS